MNKKKILFIIEDLDIGGTEKALINWIRHCDRDYFEPLVVSFRDGRLKKELDSLKIKTFIVNKDRPFDLPFLYRLIRLVRQFKPDLVHCRNGIPAISYGVLAGRVNDIPIISSIHGRSHYINTSFKTKIWFRIMRMSSLIITVTNSIKEEVAQIGKVDRNRIRVIYNGIEKNGVFKEINREDFGYKEDDFIIGTVGSLRKIKGHRYLMEAMPLVLKHMPNAKLVLIGDGAERDNLEQLSRELNIEDKVRFLGYRKDAKKLIGIFDVFILPSLSEGFPNVLLEAMVNKKPIIATTVGGVEEIVRDYHSALLIEKENAQFITEKIIEIKNNPTLGKRLAENAYIDVQNKFSLEKFVKGYEDIYMSVAGARK
jgi:glycosyltransferase involved in cell wall biosynthesis